MGELQARPKASSHLGTFLPKLTTLIPLNFPPLSRKNAHPRLPVAQAGPGTTPGSVRGGSRIPLHPLQKASENGGGKSVETDPPES